MLRECETLTRQMVPIKVKHRGRGRVGWRVRRRLRRSPSSSWLEPLTVYRVPNVAPCWHLSHDGRFALLSKHLVSAPLPSTPMKVRPNNLTDRRDNCLGISVSRAEILLFDDIDISHRISKQQYNIQKRNKEDEAAADLLSSPSQTKTGEELLRHSAVLSPRIYLYRGFVSFLSLPSPRALLH